jgi:haloalkane dehalogenase
MELPPWLDRRAWPWAPRSLDLSEGRIHYVDEGSGAPVVLVHGTPTWSFEWRHVIAGLLGRARIIALDHLGFGLSERPRGAGYRPEDHARRFAQWVDRVLPLDRFHLAVHDFGGPIALDWALDHADQLLSITVLNSWMWSFEDDPRMARGARLIGSGVGRLLYRYLNVSQRLVMPSAYGDRQKLTRDIHRQYLSVFPDAESRERVLFVLARSLLGSSGGGPDRAGVGDARLGVAAVHPATLAAGDAACPHHRHRRRGTLAARRGACRRRRCFAAPIARIARMMASHPLADRSPPRCEYRLALAGRPPIERLQRQPEADRNPGRVEADRVVARLVLERSRQDDRRQGA